MHSNDLIKRSVSNNPSLSKFESVINTFNLKTTLNWLQLFISPKRVFQKKCNQVSSFFVIKYIRTRAVFKIQKSETPA